MDTFYPKPTFRKIRMKAKFHLVAWPSPHELYAQFTLVFHKVPFDLFRDYMPQPDGFKAVLI